MDYSTLTASRETAGSIKSWVNYSRLDADEILDLAEGWIYSKLRVRQMVKTANVTITSGTSVCLLPARFAGALHFGIPGVVTALRLTDIESFRTTLGWDDTAALPEGIPTRWCIMDEQIHLNVSASENWTGKMVFYQKPAPLTVESPANWLTNDYPDILKDACRKFAYDEREEYDKAERHEKKALDRIMELRIESDEAMSGLELDFHWGE